jgi:hypothetical protein
MTISNDRLIEEIEDRQHSFEAVLGRFMESQLQLAGIPWEKTDPQLGADGNLVDFHANAEGEFKPFENEEELQRARRISHGLYRGCPWAAAAIENRVSYVVGWGHVYAVKPKVGETATAEQKNRVAEWLDMWLEANKWGERQRLNQLEGDLDGEVFLRKFRTAGGMLVVRKIACGAVTQPQDRTEERFAFGIETDPDDPETIIAYWVNGTPIEASEIQHRKLNAMTLDKRGVPLLWPWRFNFQRAMQMLRNGSKVTEIQTAFAVIKKIARQMSSSLQAWGASQTNAQATTQTPGAGTGSSNATNYQKVAPGTITTITQDQEIDLPGIGIDPTKYVEAIGGETRAIAAALVMPEYMLTGDASNNNRASAIVAGDPADQNFTRLQQQTIEWDLAIINEAAEYALASGVLREGDLDVLEITATAPSLTQRNRKEEAETRKIDIEAGILSVQTATAESGRDYETEQAQIDEHDERTGQTRATPEMPIDNMPNPPERADDATDSQPEAGGTTNAGSAQ